MKKKDGIAILYLSIGSGHQIAAEALKTAFQQQDSNISVHLEDPFADKLEVLPSVLNAFQAASIVLAPELYDVVWRRGTPYNTYERITDTGLLQEFLYDKLSNYEIDTVVATHVLPCVLATKIKRQKTLVKKVYGVITDFGVHQFWPLEDIDGYFVGHQEVKNTLIYRGIPENKIYVTGLPIKLASKTNKDPIITKIKHAKLNVLLMAGGVRSSAYIGLKHYIIELLEILQKEKLDDIHLTIVTGNQKHLYQEIREWLNAHNFLNASVLGFVQQMKTLMAQNHIIITKPGGLIIAEALASGLSLIILRPGPGQENANADFLARHGIAFRGESPLETVAVLKHCLKNPKLVPEMQKRSKELGLPNAAHTIAKLILENKVLP